MKSERYLLNADAENVERSESDVLIIGSGIAGIYTALQLPNHLSVTIITKETLDISSSSLAQGGIAVSLDETDSPELHYKDTLYAGAGLCNEENVWALVNEAESNIEKLCSFGVNFDRNDHEELSLTREGAHSKNRIIHAGDTTGKEVCDTLIAETKRRSNITLIEKTFAVDLITDETNGNCLGVMTIDEKRNVPVYYAAKYIVCATGGFGRIYSYTTNPEVATGDGAAMAYRAGAKLSDMEFIQFHPTVLYHEKDKNFLISEAVRGEGAILKNSKEEAFMEKYHAMKELAPRDVVSRAIFAEMKKSGEKHVYLDISYKDKNYLENRFPNIYKTCLSYGIDMSTDMIPVAPAEHYCMGGIISDINGKTNIEGLYACGEAASNGIHGANRLASNSLLEGLVFGNRISKDIEKNFLVDNKLPQTSSTYTRRNSLSMDETQENGKFSNETTGSTSNNCGLTICSESENILKMLKQRIRETMTGNVGIIRTEKGLLAALEEIENIERDYLKLNYYSASYYEIYNMLQIARLVIKGAIKRCESRGAHYREDYPEKDDINWIKSIIQSI